MVKNLVQGYGHPSHNDGNPCNGYINHHQWIAEQPFLGKTTNALTQFGASESRSTSSLPEGGVMCQKDEGETDLHSNAQAKTANWQATKLGTTLFFALFGKALVATGDNALPTLMSFTHGNLCEIPLIKW